MQTFVLLQIMFDPSMWKSLLKRFNWRHSAAKYLHRKLSMEDYLSLYIHSAAGYLELESELVEDLSERLINLSDTCPYDLMEIMPPSLSGLIFNQAHKKRHNSWTVNHRRGRKQGESGFDIVAILERHPELFKIENGRVTYLHTPNKEDAIEMLRMYLIEGVFIYFFAKFCHGPEFEIKVSYYQRSEPIRSALLLVTGEPDVQSSLSYLFENFQQIFKFDFDRSVLSLRCDYYSRSNGDLMKPFLGDDEPMVYPLEVSSRGSSPTPSLDSRSSSGYESTGCSGIIGCVLANPEDAGEKILPAVFGRDEEENDPMASVVKSVLDPLLFEDEERDLVTNPFALDRILNILERKEVNTRFDREARALMKVRLEMEVRQLAVRMIHDFQ